MVACSKDYRLQSTGARYKFIYIILMKLTTNIIKITIYYVDITFYN